MPIPPVGFDHPPLAPPVDEKFEEKVPEDAAATEAAVRHFAQPVLQAMKHKQTTAEANLDLRFGGQNTGHSHRKFIKWVHTSEFEEEERYGHPAGARQVHWK